MEANSEATGIPKIRILETSLADGVSEASLIAKAQKFRWQGEDDKVMNDKPISHAPADKDPIRGVALEPQRIRTFTIEYGKEPVTQVKKEAAAPQNTSQKSAVEQLLDGAPSRAFSEALSKVHLDIPESHFNISETPSDDSLKVEKPSAEPTLSPEDISKTTNAINKLIADKASIAPSLVDVKSS